MIGLATGCSEEGAERVRELVDWPDDCAAIEIDAPSKHPDARAWQARAKETANVSCEHLGPWVVYVRFADADARAAAMAARPSSERTCVKGPEVVLDGLWEGGFETFCERFGGRLTRRP